MACHATRTDAECGSIRRKYNRVAIRRPSHSPAAAAQTWMPSYYEELTEQQQQHHQAQSREGEQQTKSLWMRILRSGLFIDMKAVRLFFRFISVLNLISLTISAPIWICRDTTQDVADPLSANSFYNCYVHYAVITSVDAVLAVFFTVHLTLRVFYELWWKIKESAGNQVSSSASYFTTSKYVRIGWIVALALQTFSLWWSMAIGIHRSVQASKETGDPLHAIQSPFYYPLVLRSLSILSAIRFVFAFSVSGSGLIYSIKWKQLFWVIVFYLFFIYLYALVGVQWIGGLNERCVYEIDNESLVALPVTHCVTEHNRSLLETGSVEKNCYDNSAITCKIFPNESRPLNIDFRSTLQLGQFRTILDAFFAVYEASSLELWTFMQTTAYEGANRNIMVIGVYYASMVFFLVIFVQQSIFLVVIIESFAELRGNMSLKKILSASKKKKKSITVLEGDEHHLHLPTKNKRQHVAFMSQLSLYYYKVVERIFLALVLIDAILTATKKSDIGSVHATFLTVWQWSISALFVLEILGVLSFHLYHNQFKKFFSKYFIYLTVVAVGGLATAVLYDATLPASKFHLALFPFFQAMRFPRVLRLMPPLKRFLFKILGNGTQLLLVILMTLIFLLWMSAITIHIFGYSQFPPECSETTNEFSGILMALQSTFQVIMSEGWNDLMSETMCHSRSWIAIMICFVLLHLFASLILLNFFVAVILDNLEYPEEKKQLKLEQEQQFKKKKVWHHLRVFKFLKPKTLATPKLTSADAPNLAESDVRRFFESGDSQAENDCASYVPYVLSTTPKSRRDSNYSGRKKISASSRLSGDITNLTLLSEGSAHSGMHAPATTKMDVYDGIQSMLQNAKEVKKYNRDHDNNTNVRRNTMTTDVNSNNGPDYSEYDEYREKYHLFDSALFCMPSKHPVRKACTFILNYRIDPPKGRLQPVLATKPNQLCDIALKRAAYIGRFFLSPLPCFTWLMLIITFTTIVLMGVEYTVSRDTDNRSANPSYIWLGDLIFIIFTVTELIIKILSRGVFFNPNAAIKSLWDVLDWIIVLATITAMAIYMKSCGAQTVTDITLVNLNHGVLVVVFLRGLRPLRLISLVDSMRRVVWDVLLGWKKFLFGGILSLMFIFMFASFGVQLFASQNPNERVLGFCNDRSIADFYHCNGEFEINLYISREFLPTTERLGNAPHFLVPRVWYSGRRDFPFDTTPQAFLTLLSLLSLEGWLDVRDMLNDPTDQTTWLLSIYVHTYVFLGVNIVLQLFVGIVVNNFNEHKPDHSALLSVSQKQWTDLMQSISLRRPIKLPQEPGSQFRKFIYSLVVGKPYKQFVIFLIVLHSFTFCLPWAGVRHNAQTTVLVSLSIIFTLYYIIEVLMKLTAFGMVGYCHSWRNVFDFILAVYSFVYIICAGIYITTDNTLSIEVVTDLGLVLAVMKFFTILGKISTLQDLTVTIVQTFIKGLPLLGVLLVIMTVYTFLGCILFSGLRTGEDINHSFINFESFESSLGLVLRILTGEDWHHLLRDAMVGEPYCSASSGKCGSKAISILWFTTYYVIVTFIVINVIIAVLLENFTVFYSKGDTSVDDKVVADFRQNWYYFDKRAIGSISSSKIKLFLRMLHLKELYTHRLNAQGHKERKSFDILTDSLLLREIAEELRWLKTSTVLPVEPSTQDVVRNEGTTSKEDSHSFQSVLKTIAYRAENIQTRLEPQEFYERIEIEEHIQYEVAEKCILKWMQTNVKPIARDVRQKQRMSRAQTVKLKRLANFKSSGSVLLDVVPKLTENVLYPSDSGEDDDMPSPEVTRRFPLLSASHEEATDDVMESGLHSELADGQTLLQQSYAKLSANSKQQQLTSTCCGSLELGHRDKWHDWIRMQKDWMNNLDSDEYFDDGL